MKISRKISRLGIAGLLLLTTSGEAAVISVDWLQLGAGGNASGFVLANIQGTASAPGSIVLDHGIPFPDQPSARTLGPQYWETPPSAVNAETGDGTVSGFEIRIFPSDGSVSFLVELEVPRDVKLILAVGDLNHDGLSSTTGVDITASGASGGAVVTLVEMMAWNDGIKGATQGLDWNGHSLTTLSGNNGDSKFAFFSIDPLNGPGARITFSIPHGYDAGTGDSLFFAVGIQSVPESSLCWLMAACMVPIFVRNRNKVP